MKKIPVKPLSVNEAWQGRRFATKAYNNFKRVVSLFLNRIRAPQPPDTHLFAHYRWGQSNFGADVDNPTKPFQDVLFSHWNTKDHRVVFMLLEKVKVAKGQEFIEFHVDSSDNLIEYLECVIKELKEEVDADN